MKIFILLSALSLFGCSSAQIRKPASEPKDIVFPSNVNKAKEVFIFGNISTASTVEDFISIIEKINKQANESNKIKARVMMELPTDYNNGLPPSPNQIVEELAWANLGLTTKAKDLPNSLMHIISYINSENKLADNLWLQDFGQFYYENDTLTFLDLKYPNGNIENTSELYRYIKSKSKGLSGQINNDFQGKKDDSTLNTTLEGGDVEVLPNGKILSGNLLHPRLIEYLEKDLMQTVVTVPMEFVATGHVDEIFSIVPVPKSTSNQCGFILTYADPVYGLRLALDKELDHTQPNNRKQFIDAISYFTEKDGEKIIGKDHFSSIPSHFKESKQLMVYNEPWGKSPKLEEWYVHRMITMHNKIHEGIAKIKTELKKTCNNLVTVGLPVIFSDYAAGESTLTLNVSSDNLTDKEIGEIYKKAPVNLLMSPINMVVLNDHLLVPVPEELSSSPWDSSFTNSFKKTFQWIVSARLKKHNVEEKNIHYINSNVYIHNGGSLHCGSATVREKNQLVEF